MNNNPQVDIIVDGQWGSTGKGKLAGYLALRNNYDLIITHNGPNAGHTWKDGEKAVVVRQLPTGLIDSESILILGAGSIIDPDVFLEELADVDTEGYGAGSRVLIHPHAAVVNRECKKEERKRLRKISSTCKGTGAALSRRVWRESSAVAINHPDLSWLCKNVECIIDRTLREGGKILIEGAQGFDLSVIHGQYPFVTSRDTTAGSYLAWSGIPIRYCSRIYGGLRTYPIRVGNAEPAEDDSTDECSWKWGYSGPCYSDQEELSWEEIAEISGYGDELQAETTTVTGKVRRIFQFSQQQLRRFVSMVGPTDIFLNFINYWDSGVEGAGSVLDLSDKVMGKVMNFKKLLPEGTELSYLGTGADDGDMVRLHHQSH